MNHSGRSVDRDKQEAITLLSSAASSHGQASNPPLGREDLDAVRAALENMGTGLTVLDAAGRLLYANAAAARIVGYEKASELMAATAAGAMARFELVGIDGQPFPAEQLPSRLALEGRATEAVIRFRPRGSGADRWSLVRSAPIADAAGKIERVVTFFGDVTGRQLEEIQLQFLLRAADELNSSLDYEKTLAAVAQLAVPTLADWCAVDLMEGDQVRRVATAHADPAKLSRIAEIHRRWPESRFATGGGRDIIRSGKPRLVEHITRDMIAAGASDEAQLRLIESLDLCSYLGVPLTAYGRPIGALVFATAESGRHFSERELRTAQALAARASLAIENARAYQEAKRSRSATEESFQLMIATVKDYAIFRLDRRGIVSTWNTGAQLIKGYRAEEIIGSHFSRFYREEDVRAGKCEMELEVAGRVGRFEDEGWRVRKDGSEFWANVVITAIVDANGHTSGFVKVTRDLTERRRAEAERAARLAAEQADRSKDEFLALLGHELRNPLAPIVTALELIKLRETTDSKEHLIIERQVRHMTRLVDDLLDVSRIVMGKVDLNRRDLDLRVVVAKAIEIASPLLEQRQQHLDLRSSGEVRVIGDEERLSQVFANLITNAAKFTPPQGHIVVAVDRVGPDARVEVRDDGAGISEELLPRIFDLFVQGAQSSQRSGGLGIGLSLVRSLVNMHGGKVSAVSEGLGRGSVFSVSLPAATGSRAAAVPEVARELMVEAAQRKRILLVDDNEDALELTAELLRSIGHTIATAPDGPSALRLLEEFKAEVAVVDIGLPVMDGYELAERIQTALGPSAPLLIALSGYGQERDRARSSAAGFRIHLVKPVDADRLQEAIASLK